MEVGKLIAGADRLLAIFGNWPTFHDAEVVWIRLDRRPVEGENGATLEALIHTFEMTTEVNPDGLFVLRNHVLVHLRFREIVDLRLEDFKNQNALFRLEILERQEEQANQPAFQIRLNGVYGVDSSFSCSAIEVLAVTRCAENGEPPSVAPMAAVNTPDHSLS